MSVLQERESAPRVGPDHRTVSKIEAPLSGHESMVAPKLRGQLKMVGPNGLEPSTSSVSRKRSNQTELRAYTRMVVCQF
jgi:hypothetical protein